MNHLAPFKHADAALSTGQPLRNMLHPRSVSASEIPNDDDAADRAAVAAVLYGLDSPRSGITSIILSFLRNKLREGAKDLYDVPYPGFVTDTRSSPLQTTYELDVRNDQNLAAWKKKWRLKMFNDGTYGFKPFEESVGQRRALAVVTQRNPASAEINDLTKAKRMRAIRGARATLKTSARSLPDAGFDRRQAAEPSGILAASHSGTM